MSWQSRFFDEIYQKRVDRIHLADKYERQRIDGMMNTIGAVAGKVETLFDAGCGQGMVTNVIANAFRFTTIASDASENAMEAVHVPMRLVSSCAAIPLRDASVDIALSSDVLEHLPDEEMWKTLRELHRVSRRFILLNTPYREDMSMNEIQCNRCQLVFHRDWHLRSFQQQFFLDFAREFQLSIRAMVFCGSPRRIFLPGQVSLMHSIGVWAKSPHVVCPGCHSREFNSVRGMKNVLRLASEGIALIVGKLAFASKNEIVVLFEKTGTR